MYFSTSSLKNPCKKIPNNQIYLILHLLIVARHFGFHGAQNLPTTDPIQRRRIQRRSTSQALSSAPRRALTSPKIASFSYSSKPKGFFSPKRWLWWVDWNDCLLSDFCYKMMGEGFFKKNRNKEDTTALGKTKEELWIKNLIQDDVIMYSNLPLPSMLITEAMQKSHFCHCEKKSHGLASWSWTFHLHKEPLPKFAEIKQRVFYAHMNLGCMHQSAPFLFNSS